MTSGDGGEKDRGGLMYLREGDREIASVGCRGCAWIGTRELGKRERVEGRVKGRVVRSPVMISYAVSVLPR